MKQSTKRKLKEIYRRTKHAAKKTGRMIERVGGMVNHASERMAMGATEAFEIHQRREPHYLDLTGKRPRKVPVRRNRVDWSNISVRF
jgi:hypothetical protein